MRTADELRAERDRWKARLRELRAARDAIEAAYAAIIINTLSYALGEVSSAATRVKVA